MNVFVDTSHSHTNSKHVSTNVHSLPQCNPSAWIGPWWQGRTGNNCFENTDVGQQCRLGFAGDRDAHGRELASCKWGEGVAVEQEKTRSRSPRGRPSKGLSGRELRDRVIKQRLFRHQSAASSAGSKRQTTQSLPLPIETDRDMWEFPPARPTAPGRKRYRRGSALRIKIFGSNPSEVLKAKSEFADDKYAKSAVESVRSRLAWWQRRA